MKTSATEYFSVFFFCVLILISCDKQTVITSSEDNQNNNPPADNCTRLEEAPVIKVSGPVSSFVNSTIVLNLEYGVINGCGGFGRFETDSVDFNYNIKLVAEYEGCLCTANAPLLKTTYSFTPKEAGIYYFKFKKGNQPPVVHQLTVTK
jgi:hypothetical protein